MTQWHRKFPYPDVHASRSAAVSKISRCTTDFDMAAYADATPQQQGPALLRPSQSRLKPRMPLREHKWQFGQFLSNRTQNPHRKLRSSCLLHPRPLAAPQRLP